MKAKLEKLFERRERERAGSGWGGLFCASPRKSHFKPVSSGAHPRA